ncbi:MAG: hypothetical protein KDA24_30120, partial [Deltaproteobacteria bacterium]|nr:hypothetical protein [Deltaproteobacteria bacterium]
DGGVAMLIAGGVMEGVGIALLASSADRPGAVATTARPAARFVVAPNPHGGVSLGLIGRW